MINSYLSGASEQEDHVIHLLFSANRWEAVYATHYPIHSLKHAMLGKLANPSPRICAPAITLTSSIRADHRLTHPRPKIKAAIEQGTTVIVDRYYYSGIVYSAAKQNPALSLSWCRHPDVGLPRPDAVIFLHISPEEAAARGGYGTERYEKKAMQDRVRELFEEVRGKAEGEDFVVINAGAGVEEVQRSIWEEVRKVVERIDREEGELRTVREW